MKALALLSGGLDSTLAVKLILDQGIEVEALNFTSPFCTCSSEGKCSAAEVAKRLKIPIKIMAKGEDYLKILKKPKHGYGSGINPCIDCRIYTLKKAKQYAKQIGASFIFTGEVLDQRPMSQHKKAMDIIEKESGLKGKLLRPLSAKLLPETEAEKKGWIDRNRLLDIKGRSRKRQLELAKNLNVTDYHCPAGGCLLTEKLFAVKVKDLFAHKKNLKMRDMILLKFGRHFRQGKIKIIVGRNELENKQLPRLKNPDDYFFEVQDCGSPITILQGPKTNEAIKIAASLTARYSDSKKRKILVNYGKNKLSRSITVSPLNNKEIENIRIK
jgi:tRNA U34 2-thiouridine synthase MnmA/TrmU